MKSLGSKSTSAYEGIVIAVLKLWMDESGIDLKEEAIKCAELIPSGAFSSFADHDLGRLLMSYSDMYPRFHAWIANNSQPRAILATAYSNKSPFQSDRFQRYFYTDIGAALKDTEWWEDHKNEIEKTRQNIKKVAKVMNS